MPTVLHVTQPTDAGVATYVAALTADQLGRGWEVAVACPPDGRLSRDLADRAVRHLPWRADRSPRPNSAIEALELRRLIDRVGPDVVHLHSSKAGLAGRLAIRGRLPTIFQPHGWSWLAASARMVPATLAWERFAARWTTVYVCVGSAEADQGRTHGLRGRYRVVRNGVDLTRFLPAGERDRRAARALLDIPADAPLAVCVGRVTRQKGQDLLLAAWPAVRGRCAEARLAIVGGGDLLEPLRHQAPPGVFFTGPVDDTRPWYVAADVAVLPSRWEGLPLTMLEALATGRPVVGNDIPGIADALPAGAGATVPRDDVDALADAISSRILRPGKARAEGTAAARSAADEADLRRAHDDLAALTKHLAA